MFVANMTGNVVFSAFALVGAPGFSLSASLAALAGFLVGAWLGGSLTSLLGHDRGLLLRAGMAAELVLVAGALALMVTAGLHGAAARDGIAALLALGMGIQNAMARRLAVPDLTTIVLTMTLTGIAADVRAKGHGLARAAQAGPRGGGERCSAEAACGAGCSSCTPAPWPPSAWRPACWPW